ncbi:hypothetical protein HZS_8163 [Henneguya salminicola]|nr:hypothetical protein HZS_8163 [Henneguya salminicola]
MNEDVNIIISLVLHFSTVVNKTRENTLTRAFSFYSYMNFKVAYKNFPLDCRLAGEFFEIKY